MRTALIASDKSTGTRIRRMTLPMSAGEAGPASAGGVTSTGALVARSTRSVIDPRNSFRMPVAPRELMTISRAPDSRRPAGSRRRAFLIATANVIATRRGTVTERVLEKSLALRLRRGRQTAGPARHVGGLLEQRIVDGQHGQRRPEMGRDRHRVAQRAARRLREIDRARAAESDIDGLSANNGS